MNFSKPIKKILIKLLSYFGFRTVYFIHIGKTGGNAIKSSIKAKKFIWDNFSIAKPYILWSIDHHFTLANVPKGNYCFFVTRDPVSRFVSGFNARLREGRPKKYNPWTEEENRAFAHFKTATSLGEALNSEDKELSAKANHAMHNIKHVNTSYWDWFGNESYILSRKESILFYLRQEYLSWDLRNINEKLGMRFHDLPEDNLLSNARPIDSDISLSDKAIDNLKRWYYKEYEFLELLDLQVFNGTTYKS